MKSNQAILWALFAMSSTCLCFKSPALQKHIFLGSIQFNQETTDGSVRVYYKGQPLLADFDNDIKKAYFQLIDEDYCDELYLLVTPSLGQPKDVEFQYLKTSMHHPYRLFHLKKMVVITENQKQWHWEIKELDNSSQRSIPWETVIVLYDPKLIESIKDIFWDDKKNTIYSLPILCLKETDSHSLVRTNLTHMDFKFLHRETHHVSIMSPNNRIISMAYSQQGIKL